MLLSVPVKRRSDLGALREQRPDRPSGETLRYRRRRRYRLQRDVPDLGVWISGVKDLLR